MLNIRAVSLRTLRLSSALEPLWTPRDLRKPSGSNYYLTERLTRPQCNGLHTSSMVLGIHKKKKVPLRDSEADKELMEEDEKEEESDDEEEDDGIPKDYQERNINLVNARIDAFIKNAFTVSRSLAEQKIQEGNVFVNEKRITKKSHELSEGDTLDMVKGPCSDNVKMSEVSRAVVLKISAERKKGRLDIRVRVWKSMIVSGLDAPKE